MYKNKTPAAVNGGFWIRWFMGLAALAFCEKVSAGTLTVSFLLQGLGMMIITVYCIKELFHMDIGAKRFFYNIIWLVFVVILLYASYVYIK